MTNVRMPVSVEVVGVALDRGMVQGLTARQRAACAALERRKGEAIEEWAARVVADELAYVAALIRVDAQDDAAGAAALGTTLDAVRASPLHAALGDDHVDPTVDADAAVALVTEARNARQQPDRSPWIATAPPDDRGWAWVFPTNTEAGRENILKGPIGQGLSVVAKDGSFVSDTGSAPSWDERIDRMRDEWLARRLAARLGDPDPRSYAV